MGYAVEKTTVDSRRHRREQNRARVERIAAGTEQMDWTRSGEEMTEVMNAILTGGSTTAILNVPNRGQVGNLPRDVIVETLATVTGEQIEPQSCGELPGAVGSLCRLHVDVQEMTVQAAPAGRPRVAGGGAVAGSDVRGRRLRGDRRVGRRAAGRQPPLAASLLRLMTEADDLEIAEAFIETAYGRAEEIPGSGRIRSTSTRSG